MSIVTKNTLVDGDEVMLTVSSWRFVRRAAAAALMVAAICAVCVAVAVLLLGGVASAT